MKLNNRLLSMVAAGCLKALPAMAQGQPYGHSKTNVTNVQTTSPDTMPRAHTVTNPAGSHTMTETRTTRGHKTIVRTSTRTRTRHVVAKKSSHRRHRAHVVTKHVRTTHVHVDRHTST